MACVAIAALSAASLTNAATVGAVLDTGTQQGAAYRIDIPARWNHRLVLFFHGYYVDRPGFDRQPLDALKQQFVDRGFALAQSDYSDSGWVLDRGGADSERLRQYFTKKYGAAEQTFAVGMSMGGTLVAQALEQAPQRFAGGLSLCGALLASDALLNRGFALRAAFDYYFPDLLGPLVPVPADYQPGEPQETRIIAAFAAKPQAAHDLANFFHQHDLKELAAEIAFSTFETLDLQRKAGANPFSNADLVYTHTSDDAALNAGVKRYRADPAAAEYLAHNYTPSGRLSRPLLELHTIDDPAVPADTNYAYAIATARTGTGRNFVQQYVPRQGHCSFAPEQVGAAFDELRDWVKDGRRPGAGALPQ